jgi:hypothetical protein
MPAAPIDLFVSVILAGERDPLAVRRELAEHLDAWMSREPCGRPARGRRGPQITAVGKDNFVAANVGEAQQLCLRRR